MRIGHELDDKRVPALASLGEVSAQGQYLGLVASAGSFARHVGHNDHLAAPAPRGDDDHEDTGQVGRGGVVGRHVRECGSPAPAVKPTHPDPITEAEPGWSASSLATARPSGVHADQPHHRHPTLRPPITSRGRRSARWRPARRQPLDEYEADLALGCRDFSSRKSSNSSKKRAPDSDGGCFSTRSRVPSRYDRGNGLMRTSVAMRQVRAFLVLLSAVSAFIGRGRSTTDGSRALRCG
jgi:hypothetical protein